MNPRDIPLNLYEILKVKDFTPFNEVRSAYKKLCLKHHPDRGGDEKVMKAVNAAFSFIQKNQAMYDRLLKERG